MMNFSKIKRAIGIHLSKTRLGVLIITNSYVHKNYEWYRQLIFESEHSLEEIREFIKKSDRHDERPYWLIMRSKYTDMHCTDKELSELVSYLDN